MKGIFDDYVLWTFVKKLIFALVTKIRTSRFYGNFNLFADLDEMNVS